MRRAIIGGTGVYNVGGKSTKKVIKTIYGSVEVDIVEIDNEEIIFLARHGRDHSNPPHLINYRANMKALDDLGVKFIYSTAAVGSCNNNFEPGDVVVITDFIDFTKARPITFYDGGKQGVKHTDMSDPYCKNLRQEFGKKARVNGIEIKGEAVYVCTEGPRFETASEIKMYSKLGGDVVGMTNVPEVVLAKELGMCYSAIGIITNWCTGYKKDVINLHDIEGSIKKNKELITKTFIDILRKDLKQENCMCHKAIIEL
ncbi:S-methyl-5'-thioinosine phosphorylase [Sporosalibacterium faouarense]|uniref:S-methyl-5'-thioinosine phosphorylase n=1 Tax=Sporosalibacterium faouarense TaxID=516123 RepID=UPI00141CDC14|nr:S-methyl-5'-thioinosine phosphorylase [Sporosalibacterium faouarense]MTI48670.1 S-methyl-5'-thioinosine phosphorylase [Bacillota bacterium]